MKRGATKATLHELWNVWAWRKHTIEELERQRTRSSMSGRSYK